MNISEKLVIIAANEKKVYDAGAAKINAVLSAVIERSIKELVAEDFVGATKIGDYAFYMCPSLKSVTIPNNIKEIGGSAFHLGSAKNVMFIMLSDTPPIIQANTFNANNLKYILVPNNSIERYLSTTNWSSFADYIKYVFMVDYFEGETTIPDDAYVGNTHLVQVELPESVTSIGHRAFKSCFYLEKISWGKNLTTIGKEAFAFTSLMSIVLPDGFKSIRGGCFKYCLSLRQVVIPEGVYQLGGNAFNGCNSLNKLTLPSTVTKIGEYALCIGNTKVKATITFLSKKPPTLDATAFKVEWLNKIIVPVGCGEAYKSATNWSLYADYIEEAEI